MNSPENPVSRWSRRKREAAAANKQANASPRAAAPPSAAEDQASSKAKPCAEPTGPTLDPKKLPPIDSITTDTDIRAFLAPGVPRELAQAALRRAWTADPKIRDFVGLADYDWDFNAQGAMTGFGSLDLTEELRNRLVEAIQGPAESAGGAPPHTPPQPADIRTSYDKSATPPRAERADQDQSSGKPPQGKSQRAALQHRPEQTRSVRCKQGGALPK